MDPLLADDLARLPELLGMTREYAARFLAGLAERPVAHAEWGAEGTAVSLPAEGRGLEAALAALLDAHPAFHLLAPARLNVVCFTLTDHPTPARLAAFTAAVTASGEAFLTPTVYGGVPALRAAFSNWRTTEADTARVYEALVTAATESGPSGD